MSCDVNVVTFIMGAHKIHSSKTFLIPNVKQANNTYKHTHSISQSVRQVKWVQDTWLSTFNNEDEVLNEADNEDNDLFEYIFIIKQWRC